MKDRTRRDAALTDLAAQLGIAMRQTTLYDRALTHASVAAETSDPTPDYESLEFLGDAVLGLAIAHYLFEHLPDRTPGEYSRMRAGLVNRRCLARVAQELGIAVHIRLGKGEEMSGGRERAALLADCLEALIGAVYLDLGWSTAHQFVMNIFADELLAMQRGEQVWDFKSRLQNICQADRIPLPVFEVVRSHGPDHDKEFEVVVYLRGAPRGRGAGSSKKEAEQNAAREALEREGHQFV